MNKLTASAFALAVTLASQAAYAHGDWKAEFNKADTNNDGKLSLVEVNAAGAEKFNKVDANKDGFITVDEKKAYIEANKDGDHEQGDWKAGFDKIDADKDGRISTAEANAAGAAMFKEVDANSDGFVTLEEKKAYYEGKHGKVTGGEDHPSATQKLNPDNTTPAEAKR